MNMIGGANDKGTDEMEYFTRDSILAEKFSIEQCRAAAEKGNASAQDVLGDCYQYGWFVKKDFAAAIAWYKKAAEQGNAAAQRSLGWCCENGYGMEKDDR